MGELALGDMLTKLKYICHLITTLCLRGEEVLCVVNGAFCHPERPKSQPWEEGEETMYIKRTSAF